MGCGQVVSFNPRSLVTRLADKCGPSNAADCNSLRAFAWQMACTDRSAAGDDHYVVLHDGGTNLLAS